MPFDWEGFLKIAETLKDNPGEYKEAAFRTAISRAYYSIYHNALDYAMNQGFPKPKSDSHAKLIEHFKLEDIENNKRIAVKIDELYQWRIRSDYRADFKNLSQSVVSSAINRAKNIKSLL